MATAGCWSSSVAIPSRRPPTRPSAMVTGKSRLPPPHSDLCLSFPPPNPCSCFCFFHSVLHLASLAPCQQALGTTETDQPSFLLFFCGLVRVREKMRRPSFFGMLSYFEAVFLFVCRLAVAVSVRTKFKSGRCRTHKNSTPQTKQKHFCSVGNT